MKNYVGITDCRDRFQCVYLDENAECEAMGSECIGDMCENWKDCLNCQRKEECRVGL